MYSLLYVSIAPIAVIYPYSPLTGIMQTFRSFGHISVDNFYNFHVDSAKFYIHNFTHAIEHLGFLENLAFFSRANCSTSGEVLSAS